MEKQNGKGSKPRPYSVEYEEFAKNWDTIFHKYNKSTFKRTLINEEKSGNVIRNN